MKYLILLIAFTGCGRAYQDNRAQPFIEAFETQYKLNTGFIEVEFTDVGFEPHAIGRCSAGVIYVNTSTWNYFSNTTKTNLIYHELGHCLLNRPHLDALYSDGCPKSIMNTFITPDECFERHKLEMLNELYK